MFADEAVETDEDPFQEENLTELENHAHRNHALLSSDAMRYLAHGIPSDEQISTLDSVIAAAQKTYPSEDGWVVINLSRMEQLLAETAQESVAAVLAATPVAPVTAGSLAEAILSGNVVAAYEMIEHRPMVALADAAADIDAIYRSRKGEEVSVSDLLITQARALSTEQLEAAIVALTSALDGTYTDEASAVKMAIMKAVKAVA